MSHSKTEADGTLVTHAPLFASVWLALFNQLRKNYAERRIEFEANKKSSESAVN